MNKKHLVYLSALTLLGCAGNYRPESFADKMSRYKSHDLKVNSVPQMAAMDVKYRKQASRRPASAQSKFLTHSNKRVYFLALFDQYNSMKSFLKDDAPEVKYCPNFHTSVVNYGKRKHSKKNYAAPVQAMTSQINAKDKSIMLALYPELALKVSNVENAPTVYDLAKDGKAKGSLSDYVQKGLKTHVNRTHQEIMQLCENGYSNNYFIFENMITYMNKHTHFRSSKKAMETLLKVTVFSNLAIINSLEMTTSKGRTIASSFSAYDEEIFLRMNAYWSKGYFAAMKYHRK